MNLKFKNYLTLHSNLIIILIRNIADPFIVNQVNKNNNKIKIPSLNYTATNVSTYTIHGAPARRGVPALRCLYILIIRNKL